MSRTGRIQESGIRIQGWARNQALGFSHEAFIPAS